jgi:transposase-like protein
METRDRALIRAWLAGLPAMDRALAQLLMEGHSIREARKRLGITERQVRRSVQRLRRIIGKDAA